MCVACVWPPVCVSVCQCARTCGTEIRKHQEVSLLHHFFLGLWYSGRKRKVSADEAACTAVMSQDDTNLARSLDYLIQRKSSYSRDTSLPAALSRIPLRSRDEPLNKIYVQGFAQGRVARQRPSRFTAKVAESPPVSCNSAQMH